MAARLQANGRVSQLSNARPMMQNNAPSPALSAMSMRAQQPAAQPLPAGDIAPQQVQAAKVDTGRTDALYKDQLAQSDADKQLMQTVGLNTISGLQTRNAENAARMGLASGGASYLSGQRSAAVAGINAFNQGLQQWGNQRQGIMNNQGGILSNAANSNAGYQQQAGSTNATLTQQANMNNANNAKEREQADQAAKSQYYTNELARIQEQAKKRAAINGTGKDDPVAKQAYESTLSAYNKAVTDGQWQVAEQLKAQLWNLVGYN